MPFNSMCRDTQREAHKVARYKAGLNPNLSLPEACADFYVLERLIADGSLSAEAQLAEYEQMLAKEFSAYLDIAIGGELRHVYHVNSGSDSDECGDCCASTVCTTSYCGCGNTHCNNSSCGCAGYDDETGEEEDCEDEDCGCGDEVCEDSDCGCADEWRYFCDCGDCPRCGRNTRWDDNLDPRLSKFAKKVRTMLGHGNKAWNDDRALAWDQWVHIRHIHGIEAVKMARDCFNDDNIWHDGGFGGRPWGTAAGLLYDYLRAKISPRVFINMAWSLQHNGGCIFNKVYNETSKLQNVLNIQANSTDYNIAPSGYTIEDREMSLLECASDRVRKSWHNFGYLRQTKQGQRYLGMVKLDQARAKLTAAIHTNDEWGSVGWQVQVDILSEKHWTSE